MSNIATLPVAQFETTHDVSTQAMVFDPTVIAGMQRMAEMMSAAKVTIPKHLAGSPSDCLAIIMQAAQWRMNPFAVAQKTHLVNGALGYEAQLVNAVIAQSGAIRGRFHYEYRGEGANIECRVGAIPAGESDVVWGEWLSAASVQVKNSPLWKTNPKQQLGYLQVKNWARLYAPGAILGVYSTDELEVTERDMGPAQVVESAPAHASRTESVKAKLASKRKAPEPSPDLDDVMSMIASAESLDQLKAAASMAAKLDSDSDKTAARRAYGERKAALEQPAEPVPFDLTPPDVVSEILAGIARHDPEDLDVWLDEARAQGIAGEDLERIQRAIAERMAQ